MKTHGKTGYKSVLTARDGKEIYIIAIKDHYLNIRGGKKIKVLTGGKKYKYIKSNHGLMVLNDINLVRYYKERWFTTVSVSRSHKLDSLGI